MKAKIKKFFIEFYYDWKYDKTVFFVSLLVLFIILAFVVMTVWLIGIVLVSLYQKGFTFTLALVGIISVIVAIPTIAVLTGKYLSAHEDTDG